ncbi:hypothetical protein KR018_002989 [Drosophila ironensis]|nr:hypothetical protein KR018_002989 [Drosophila ironensis]
MGRPSFLRIFFEVSRLIGLSNLQYDSRRQCFRADHVPTIAWCFLLNVAYVLILPVAVIMLTGNIYNCPDQGMFGVVYNVVGLAQVLTILLLIASVWIRRRRLQRLGNDLLIMLHNLSFALGNDCRRRCLLKLLLTSSRFVLLAQQLLAEDTLVRCKISSKFQRAIAPYYMAASVYALLMLLLECYVDLTVYLIQVAGNWLLQNMVQSVRDMSGDLVVLPQPRGNIREISMCQILADWRRLWQRCLHLDKLLQQFLEIFQWQILSNLLATYIFEIVTLFRLWIYMEFDENFHLWRGIFFALLFLSHHFEVLMQFSVFENNRRMWLELRDSVGKLAYINFRPRKTENRSGFLLSRYLEISLLYLNRKLQPQPQRVRRLHIAGFFDLSHYSVHRMTRSVLENLMVLLQIAYKIYG